VKMMNVSAQRRQTVVHDRARWEVDAETRVLYVCQSANQNSTRRTRGTEGKVGGFFWPHEVGGWGGVHEVDTSV